MLYYEKTKKIGKLFSGKIIFVLRPN